MVDGCDGNLTSSMWARMTQCSQDTALRDITDLIDRNILVRTDAGGRSTNYRLR
jgi:Fic family protein